LIWNLLTRAGNQQLLSVALGKNVVDQQYSDMATKTGMAKDNIQA
jgi:hypothetical protein